MLEITLAKIGLLNIFIDVLVLPFKVRVIEGNLEIFLFILGLLAMTLSGYIPLPGEQTGWSWNILTEGLTTPLNIISIYWIPIGIVQIVLLVGIIMHVWSRQIEMAIYYMVKKNSRYPRLFSD
jgi:predicted cation transporter